MSAPAIFPLQPAANPTLVNGCEQDDRGTVFFYVQWRNGNRTRTSAETLYKVCPYKVLGWFEAFAYFPPRVVPALSRTAWAPAADASWAEDVLRVDDIRVDCYSAGALVVHLTWRSGRMTVHPAEVAYEKCPQQVLRFYETVFLA